MLSEGKVGQRLVADGAQIELRMGRTGEVIVSDAHARYYEPTMRGQVYSTGSSAAMTLAATHSIATLGATCTPICGVYNPLGSNVNLVLMKAKLSLNSIAVSSAPTGAFYWAMSLNNGAVSTGLNPLNRKTLVNAGSQAKGFAGQALTGLTTALVVQHAATFGGTLQAASATSGVFIGSESTEELDGSIIIPPGGVLALLSGLTPTTTTAASMLMWEEIPLSASV